MKAAKAGGLTLPDLKIYKAKIANISCLCLKDGHVDNGQGRRYP